MYGPSGGTFYCVVYSACTYFKCRLDHFIKCRLRSGKYCILSDASCVESCTDEADFLTEFGYIDGGADQIRKGLKAFKACKRTAAAIDRIFTEDEKTALNEYYENY